MHAGRNLCRDRRALFRAFVRFLTRRSGIAQVMHALDVILGLLTVGLLAYLFVALLKPEIF
jgi:K+-transporting ATPase KdpF subunit